jgi:DNA ligase (NAD+)
LFYSHGGSISESVGNKTTYLVTGDATGSKLEKARKSGVEILDEKAFLAVIESLSNRP